MAHTTVQRLTSLVVLLAVTSSAKDQARWSRQISTYTADISDWVPLSGPVERDLPPIKRQAVAEPRILSEPFPGIPRPTGFSSDIFSRNYYNNQPNRQQLYLQSVPSVPSAPQNFLTDQGFGQNIRFGLSQPNFPLNQGFVTPNFGYETDISQIKPRPIPPPAPAVKFDGSRRPPQQPLITPVKFNAPKTRVEGTKYIDGYRAENNSDFARKPVSLQKMNYDKKPEIPVGAPKVEKEEVQLLYVPLESLNRGQFNYRNPVNGLTSQMLNSELYTSGQRPLQSQRQEVPAQKPTFNNFGSQEYFKNYNSQRKDIDQVPKFSTITNPFPTLPPTTPKPKKLKPHQPPLAIFITVEASKNNQIKVGDVLGSLKNADSVAVLDSVNPLNAPKVFIGPSSLQPPEKYVKFDLPYLSNIDHSDKKLRQLPFFVAPLSYNTPQGFAKIPFPSPHVGSVVINSQIKETTNQPSSEEVKSNYFAGVYRQEPATQKPSISFYSTAAPENKAPNNNYQSNYYSFEPQMVSTIRPKEPELIAQQKPSNYFLNNIAGTQYEMNNYQNPIQQFSPVKRVETTTTPRAILPTTSRPTTYPNQLLETHNPFSINHAFHFNTPLDYHSYFDDQTKPLAAPGTEINPPQTPSPTQTTSVIPPRKEEVATEKDYQQSPFLQNYNPEIHYNADGQNSRYPSYNTDYSTKPESGETYKPVSTDVNPPDSNNQEYTVTQDTQTQVNENTEYNTYPESHFEPSSEPESTLTTTTTTRRPLRTRGRPRYTTTPRSSGESGEFTTKAVTRRPLRERRPSPPRSRYEPNKITTEKATRKPIEYNSNESTTKSTGRTRARGRVQFKPSESDEIFNKKKSGTKDQDLAYQRDVLHQNYPVTLMERISTVDIEGITEPTAFKSTRYNELATENYDTENAYTNEKAAVSQYSPNTESNDDIPVFATRSTANTQTDSPYVPKLTTREEYNYNSRNPESTDTTEREEEYPKQTTSFQRDETEPEYVTEPTVILNDPKGLSYSVNKEYSEETTIVPEDTTRSQEDEEENVVQTTPSYNRVRVRPGVIRQYHQSTTEASKTKTDRRRPVTYRPAFDRRRTTMRIDEIEADLKTKQIHSRPEVQDYRHPVYKPEPTTEAPATQESSTRRGQYKRRRPSYSQTTEKSTESSVTKKNTYEVKNRFRGRRPTTDKPAETQTEPAATTVRPVSNRFSQRPRLSERFKKPERQENEDQEPNYSYNRPKYAAPTDQWSPKINTESFKPYNPNNIVDETKLATTERRSDRIELDIITARNEYEDMLISVTPASNNRNNKKIPEIPPTLEAFVEQSKVTNNDSGDKTTFESMLEEVMKNLEEQDEDEYSSNVMKHKGGEIGEIPPERIISSGDNARSTVALEATTNADFTETTTVSSEETTEKKNRRGFWKKVKVRPVAESIDVAESQYYTNTVNALGDPVKQQTYDKTKQDTPKPVTTDKSSLQFMKDMLGEDETSPDFDIFKITEEMATDKTVSPGDLDLGTGSPDPTEYTTEPTVKSENPYSFMDYLFGVTSEDQKDTKNETEVESKAKEVTTEVSFIPDEVTEVSEDKKEVGNSTEQTTASPAVVSTSMSTEISHETEICFRGKCIKTNKPVL